MRARIALVVRLAGALISVLAVAMGIRVMGAEQFGVTVVLTGAGTLIALPATAQERLLLRLAAVGNISTLREARRRTTRMMILAALVGTLMCLLLPGATFAPFGTLAVVLYAITTAWIVCSQAVMRGRGSILWGQAPLEIIRPTVTLLSYVTVAAVVPSPHQGVVCTLVIAIFSVLPLAFAPRGQLPVPPMTRVNGAEPTSRAALALTLQSAVATGVERGTPIVLGMAAGHASVAVFAVVLKVVQLSNAAQALAYYLGAPTLARLQGGAGPSSWDGIRAAARRIRLVGMLTAVPVMTVCVLAPGLVAGFAGLKTDMRGELLLAAVAVLFTAMFGPATAVLSTGPHEMQLALCHLVALGVGCAAFATGVAPHSAVLFLALCHATWNLLMWLVVRRQHGIWI